MANPGDNVAQAREFLARFDQLVAGLDHRYRVETLAPRVHVIHPSKAGTKAAAKPPQGRDVPLTITALIHGVEVAGLAILVEILELVTRGNLVLEFPLGVALGNVPAALKGVRFVERDLNRSFGRPERSTAEDLRADELELLLARSIRLLDIHQVKLSIDRPFWIFPYTPKGFAFARAVAPDVSLITHWGRGFSTEGKCSDEWLNHSGGYGVTIELGQNGFDPDQISRGVNVARGAIDVTSLLERGSPLKPVPVDAAPIYTWGEIIPYPQTGEPVLDQGWHNFKIARAGERVGSFNGQVVTATVTGPVLFPKYPDPLPDGSYSKDRPAAELMRVLKEITTADLPL